MISASAMTSSRARRSLNRKRIGADLTVLEVVHRRRHRPVYIVWHARLACPVACKALRSKKRAQDEARILKRLRHPYIVRSFGTYAARYLLTEFLDGPTLAQLAAAHPHGRLSLSNALRIAVHLASALTHIHQRGFIYLDMKPGNVVVRDGRPILIDFGTTRAARARRPALVHGTDPYIAPEECRCRPITTAADVFGLGVTFYELATGHLPFPEGTKSRPFPQTSTKPASMRRHRASIPRALDTLVLRCLEKKPDDRPSLRELMLGLHHFIKTGPRMWPPGFVPPHR